jgi:AcrR family transcriptional regulator
VGTLSDSSPLGSRPSGGSTRRRGTNLTHAIYLATLNELAETSFEELSFDKIAIRAGAGKASLYRRWSSPKELLLEALTDSAAGFGTPRPPNTGSVRSDLISTYRGFARVLDQPHGRALRPLMTQRPRYPELYAEIQRLLVEPRLEVVMTILRAGAARGEVAPEAVRPRIAAVGHRLLIAEHMDSGALTGKEIESVVTEILLPLLTTRSTSSRD